MRKPRLLTVYPFERMVICRCPNQRYGRQEKSSWQIIRSQIGVAMAVGTMAYSGATFASLGPYLHGDGVASLGLGGVSQVATFETYAIAANPALAAHIGTRYDVGLDIEQVLPSAEVRGNLLGPDKKYIDSFRNVFAPLLGITFDLSDAVTIGVSGFGFGVGASYDQSPFERFGGASEASFVLGNAGVSNVLAWKVSDDEAVGLSLNVSYQLAQVEGLEPFKLLSSQPDRVTDNGLDGAFGIGASIGWHAFLGEWTEVGATYRTKTWSQRLKKYEGMLPDGRLEFPARLAAGVAVRPGRNLVIAAEVLRIYFSQEAATGNLGLGKLKEGAKLGEKDGPGFGWMDQDVFKVGVEWHVSPSLTARVGFLRATQIIRRSETFFAVLGPAAMTSHFTAGATLALPSNWEVSGYVAFAPYETVRGSESIPVILGGGEVDITNGTRNVGFSFGRTF